MERVKVYLHTMALSILAKLKRRFTRADLYQMEAVSVIAPTNG